MDSTLIHESVLQLDLLKKERERQKLGKRQRRKPPQPTRPVFFLSRLNHTTQHKTQVNWRRHDSEIWFAAWNLMAPKPKPAPSQPAPPPALEDLFTTLNRHIQASAYDNAVKLTDQSPSINLTSHFKRLSFHRIINLHLFFSSQFSPLLPATRTRSDARSSRW